MKTHLMFFLLMITAMTANSADLGFRFKDGKCLNEKGIEGLNPGFFGQCSDLRGKKLGNLDFTGFDFTGSKFNSSDLKQIKFHRAILNNIDFSNSLFEAVDFYQANISDSKFSKSIFRSTKAIEARIEHSDFSEITFQENNLEKSKLLGSNFTNADFKKANLNSADLTGSNFENVDFKKADLRQTILTQVKLKNSLFDSKTKLTISKSEAESLGMIFYNLFEFSGVKNNLKLEELEGWKICHNSLYNTNNNSISQIMESCKTNKVMVGCRKVGSKSFDVLAQGSHKFVFQITGDGNNGVIDNGVKFYYSTDYSMGFAAADAVLNRSSCDYMGDKAKTRLCMHTSQNRLVEGYRCGDNEGLGGSSDYERVFFKMED